MRSMWVILLTLLLVGCLQTPPGVEGPARAPATLLEEDPNPSCLPLRCPVPPAGCRYGAPDVADGCPVNCGPINCSPDTEDGGSSGGGGGICPNPPVCIPRVGCGFPNKVYQNGCLISCGEQKCDPLRNPDNCPLPPTKCGQQPPLGCEWSIIRDAQGCITGCEPVRENSLFDAGSCDQSFRCELQKDANGCVVSCGSCPIR